MNVQLASVIKVSVYFSSWRVLRVILRKTVLGSKKRKLLRDQLQIFAPENDPCLAEIYLNLTEVDKLDTAACSCLYVCCA